MRGIDSISLAIDIEFIGFWKKDFLTNIKRKTVKINTKRKK
jgi:hypothetical protein